MKRLILFGLTIAGALSPCVVNAQDTVAVAPASYACAPREAAGRRYRMNVGKPDPFEGYTKTKAPWFELQSANRGLGARIANLGNDQWFRMELQRFVGRDSTPSSQLFLIYDGKDWIFVREGESLVFLADSTRIGLSGNGSAADRDVGGMFGVSERAMYEISDEDIRAIARAKTVKVRVYGSRGYSDHVLPKVGACTFARFASELLDRTP